jgi:hypothetical protein
MTYSSVVSCESVRLAFLIATLNDIDIMSCDLENAYHNAKCLEKIWFEGGLECGKDKGKVLMQSTIILYESLLQQRLFVLEKRIAKPTMLIC